MRGRRSASLGLAIVVSCVACVSTPAASSTPTRTLQASGQATPSAQPATAGPSLTTSPSPAPAEIQPRTAVRVTVAELNVRQEPTTSSSVRRVVKRGALFLVSDFAPIEADGYTWWFTEEIVAVQTGLPELPEFPGRVDGGYIAVASATSAYVDVVPARCPGTATLANIVGMLAGEQRACFGNSALTVEGLYGCWICGDFDPIVYRPAWLAHPSLHAVWPGAYRNGRPLMVHLPEALAEPAPGSMIRMTGHFDDARSSDCAIEVPPGIDRPPVKPMAAELWCRQHYVADTYDVIAFDPSFPPNG